MDLGEGVSKAKKSPKSLEKVSRGQGPKSPKKVSKKVRKVPKKSLKMGFWRLFGPFSRLSRTFGSLAPGDCFETFWRLFGFWPRDSFSQVHATSTPVDVTYQLAIVLPLHRPNHLQTLPHMNVGGAVSQEDGSKVCCAWA